MASTEGFRRAYQGWFDQLAIKHGKLLAVTPRTTETTLRRIRELRIRLRNFLPHLLALESVVTSIGVQHEQERLKDSIGTAYIQLVEILHDILLPEENAVNPTPASYEIEQIRDERVSLMEVDAKTEMASRNISESVNSILSSAVGIQRGNQPQQQYSLDQITQDNLRKILRTRLDKRLDVDGPDPQRNVPYYTEQEVRSLSMELGTELEDEMYKVLMKRVLRHVYLGPREPPPHTMYPAILGYNNVIPSLRRNAHPPQDQRGILHFPVLEQSQSDMMLDEEDDYFSDNEPELSDRFQRPYPYLATDWRKGKRPAEY